MVVYEQIGKGYDLTRHADPEIAAHLADYLFVIADKGLIMN
ncbi:MULTISPECIES: hypothetical protein [unclassified Nostoc]|nr:hypothetical protein [Nostoc sp. DedQUE03]MDZ7976192.1 hypothetical protein [Nostoc sp. DedQUE03]MDZ8046388.1 hypothetical protein [Nostoc sp. DedQUE02]